MWCPSPSAAWVSLSQHIGNGRVHAQGALRLTMERQGGPGLVWSLTVAGQRCRAWCEESAWCQWIAPLLPVPALAQIDKALLTPLALWSWQPVMVHLADEQEGEAALQITPPTKGTLAEAWDPQLILVREDTSQLALRLLDWPAQWLIERSRSWKPLASGCRVPPLAISVVAGWCRVPDQVLETIRLGEGLRLSGPVDLWHGEAWLFQEQPLARVRFTNTQQAAVEAIMAERSDWPPEMGDAVQALSITVVAEIGQLWVPLEQLAALQVGEILQGESLFEGAVRLKANGRYLGSGQLIEVGGHWVVQIDCWFNQQPLTSSQEVAAATGAIQEEALERAALATPVDLTHQEAAVDALLPQEAAAATGAIQEEVLERAALATPVDLTHQEPVVDALLPQEAAAATGAIQEEALERAALATPVDLTHQEPVVDALLPQEVAAATGAIQEEALERAALATPVDLTHQEPAVDALLPQEAALERVVEAVEAVIEEEKKGEASVIEISPEAVTALDHDGGESGEEECAVEREETMVIKQGVAAMRSAQGSVLEQHEQALATATGQKSLAVTAAETAGATPPVVMPPKPPRPPKALRAAMNSMARAVAGRRKPGNPSTS